jgi:hypothetical protein
MVMRVVGITGPELVEEEAEILGPEDVPSAQVLLYFIRFSIAPPDHSKASTVYHVTNQQRQHNLLPG